MFNQTRIVSSESRNRRIRQAYRPLSTL